MSLTLLYQNLILQFIPNLQSVSTQRTCQALGLPRTAKETNVVNGAATDIRRGKSHLGCSRTTPTALHQWVHTRNTRVRQVEGYPRARGDLVHTGHIRVLMRRIIFSFQMRLQFWHHKYFLTFSDHSGWNPGLTSLKPVKCF